MPPSDITWIHVADNAVKIGLGALIGGFFAFLVARFNANSAIQKLIFERRSKILSEAAQGYESFFQAFFKYSCCLAGIGEASKTTPEDPRQESFTQSLIAEKNSRALALRIQWADQIEKVFAAHSQLMLLGEEPSIKKAELLFNAIMAADASYNFDGKNLSLQNFDTVNKAVAAARIAFNREMQRAFRKN